MTKPQCVLLVGLPGSGKTRLARALEAQGFARICPDEEMFRRYGRYGTDFPRGQYLVRERPVLDDLAIELSNTLRSGTSVVFDHGLWTPAERAEWREHATSAGASPTVVYLPVSHEVLWERVQIRNADSDRDPNSIFFSEEDLLRFASRFVPPSDGEAHIVSDGNPDDLLQALVGSPRSPRRDTTNYE